MQIREHNWLKPSCKCINEIVCWKELTEPSDKKCTLVSIWIIISIIKRSEQPLNINEISQNFVFSNILPNGT